ncbi:MAG: F-box protein [Candidatus Protochlamydia sp.]|nr:F-box protein [Candidatus Protochlamydia sp.]
MRINETTTSCFNTVLEPVKKILNSTHLKILTCFVALAALAYGIHSLVGRIKRRNELLNGPINLFNRTIVPNEPNERVDPLTTPVPVTDFTSFLPSEIKEHVANYLDANDLVNITHTSKHWNQFVDKSLISQFLLILNNARRLDLYRHHTLEIEKLIAQFNPNLVSKNYSNHSEVLLEIVKVEMLSDIEKAKETALRINDKSTRARAFLEIASIDPLHSLIEAKLIATEHVGWGWGFDGIKREIVKLECLYNLEEAKVTAALIRDDHEKFNAWKEIIKKEALIDIQAAKNSVLTIEDTYDKDCLYLEIVKIEMLSNPEEAKATVQLIQHASYKIEALVEIAKLDAIPNFEEARAVGRLMLPHFHERYQAFLIIERAQVEVVKRLASYKLPEAKALAQKFDVGFLKGLALVEIAKVETSPDLEELKALALKTARLPGGMHDGTELLLEIVKVEALLDANEALATAMLFNTIYNHQETEQKLIPEIIRIKALSNSDEAKALAHLLPCAYLKNLSFLEILKVEAKNNVLQAKATLEEIKDNDRLKFEGSLCLAENALKKIIPPERR